jgi:hypothetical protein
MIVFLLLMILTGTVAAVVIARRNDAATHEEFATLLWSPAKAALAEAHAEPIHEEIGTPVGIQKSRTANSDTAHVSARAGLTGVEIRFKPFLELALEWADG